MIVNTENMTARKNGEVVTMTDGRQVTITDAPAMGDYDYAGILPDQTRMYLSEAHIAPSIPAHTITPGGTQ